MLFTPTTDYLGKMSALELYGIAPDNTGEIIRIESESYIFLKNSAPGMGVDWDMFTLIKHAPSTSGRNK